MPEVSGRQPGQFCWYELATPDPAKAKAFYSGLFGWSWKDDPTDMGVYTLFKLRDLDVGACYEQMKDQREQGIPANWMVYVQVADADASTKKAAELGAKVLMGPFDVKELGRMSVLMDPQGATFSIWQPKSHTGSRLENESGTAGWCELATSDPEAAKTFYSALFGWKPRTSADKGMPYTEWDHGEWPVGGMYAIADGQFKEMPPNWGTYFNVDDCDASVAKAAALGGKAVWGPFDVPNVGRMAGIADPTGAMFAIIRLDPHGEAVRPKG